jgi:hypothetical protein
MSALRFELFADLTGERRVNDDRLLGRANRSVIETSAG